MTSTQWVEYHVGTKRKSYNSLPTSNITAEAVTVDGFALSQTDNAGVTTTAGRSYTANGMILTETNTVIECAYDHMGRRATKKVTVDGNITLHQRYLYRGYLQIACCDLTRSNHPALWFITWDPTQPIATRPLAIQKDGTWYSAPAHLALQGSRSQVCSRLGVWLLKSQPAYGWDLTKNICELYGSNGYIRTAYSYTPYGEITESANEVYQPIQWSSEYNDTELGLVYYNYRHYNPMDGRWIGRDKVREIGSTNLYGFTFNKLYVYDYLGLLTDEELYECININVKTFVRWLVFLSKEIEWQSGKENSITVLGYKFYRYPVLVLSVQWKETNKCKCTRKKLQKKSKSRL